MYAVAPPELHEPPEEEDPELDPVHVPVVVQLVHVILLPTLKVLQLEQEVAVPPLEYVPEEHSRQFDPLR